MSYIYYVFLLAFICFSGSFMSVIAGFGGIIMIFYLCFKWGPKLGMIALPVSICFFLCVWLDDFARMYAKHVLISVPIFLVVAVVFCHFYYYEEDYKKIVIAVTAGFTAITMILLATWMYKPKEFPVPDNVAKIEIQQIEESIQVVYADPAEFENFLESLEHIEMRGSFKELADVRILEDTYRLTFRNRDGKDLGTYYFLNKYHMAKPFGKHYIFYRWAEGSQFPYQALIDMHDKVVK